MSYKHQLGSFPYADGDKIEDFSIYIGNNRFFRIVSQENNRKTLAAMYEADNVYSSTPNITMLSEQVILENDALIDFKMCQLGDGNIFIIHDENYESNIYLSYTIISFDDQTQEFTIEVKDRHLRDIFDQSNEDNTGIVRYDGHYSSSLNFTIQSYSNKSVLLYTIHERINDFSNDDRLSCGIITDVYGTNPSETSTNVFVSDNSLVEDSANEEEYNKISRIVDDHWLISIPRSGNNDYSRSSLFDISTGDIVENINAYKQDLIKLKDNRYLTCGINLENNNTAVAIGLSDSLNNLSEHRTNVDPNQPGFDSSESTQYKFLSAPLDEFHFLYFQTQNNDLFSTDNAVHCYVIKVYGEDWAEVSPQTSNNGIKLIDNVYTGSGGPSDNDQEKELGRIHNPNFVQIIDTTHYCIQTAYDTFQFIEIQ